MTKKIKLTKIDEDKLRRMVKEFVQSGKKMIESFENVALNLGMTISQVAYIYYKPNYKHKRPSITKLRNKSEPKVAELQDVKVAESSMIISMTLVSSFYIRDNQLIVTFK